jgi:adenylylsulfate kinase
VFVDTSLETCIARDPKGLYAKAQAGEIQDMTGIDDPYEEPVSPELSVPTEQHSVDECCEMIIAKLDEMGYLADVEEC